MGLIHPETIKGEEKWNAKLNDAQVRKIYADRRTNRLPMNQGVGHTIIGLVKQHGSGVMSTHIQRNPHIMCAPKIPKADPLIGEAAKQDADIAASMRDIAKDQLAWEKERAIKQDPLVENIVSFIAE